MTTQYENLATLDAWNDFFKVSPAELPAERQMRGRKMSGFIRGTVLPSAATTDLAVPAVEAASDGAT